MAAEVAPGGWACEQLTEYVATLADAAGDRLLQVAVDRAAEALEAEVGALVIDGAIEACIGFPRGQVPTGLLVEVANSGSSDVVVPGLGRCAALVAQFPSETAGRLLVLRVGDSEWSLDERNLLRGMARALALSRDATRTLSALHERQALLERLTRIQRSITSRAPLPDVLESIVFGAHELLGEAIVAYRRICADDSTMAEILCACGVEPGSPLAGRIKLGNGAGGRAITEGRLVVMHDYATSPDALDRFAEHGLQAAMAAPVREDGVTIGSLVVASTARGRRYSEAEQEMLLAFAEHASLAVTDARTVESLRRALRDARHDAMHDVLTGLPNRALLRDRLSRASARAARHRTSVALVFVDLDGFKDVNDSLGHDVGDQLLVAVSNRFLSAIRDSDTVARLGGDEFAVLVEDVESGDDLDFVAARLLDTFAEPFVLDGREVSVTASVGVALCDADSAAHQTLLRDADLAMYEAKRSGGGRHVRFAKDMHQQTIDRLNTEQALRTAIATDQLVLHYQPICDITTGDVVAVEALVRWQHPSRGLVMPAEFIHVAESSRLISALGEWVLRAACTQAAMWPSHIRVAVNLSPRQVDAKLVPIVQAILDETGLPASRLELEVTEGVAMADSPETFGVIDELHALGIHVAIDDFGTGYSSLARLRALPVDVLKIDRAFVSDVTTPRGVALISAIVALCRGSGLTAVAEGVETEEQLRLLRELGCPMAQGYLLGRPAPAADVEGLLHGIGLPRQRRLVVHAS